MITLQELYEHQDAIQTDRYRVVHGPEYLRTVIIGLLREAGELIDETDWCPWKTIDVNRPAVVEEMADVLIFLMDIGWNYGITGQELAEATKAKQEYNLTRPDHSAVGASTDAPSPEEA